MTIDASAVARVLGITPTFYNLRAGAVQYLPQRIAVFAQGNSASTYPSTKFAATSALAVANVMGFGSMAHLIARQLFPANGDGVGTIPVTFYPLADHGSAVTAEGTITPTGTQTATKTYYVRAGGVLSQAFTLAAGANVALACESIETAVNATPEMPIIATDNTTSVGIEAKWGGATGNDIVLEIIGEEAGIAFGITAMASGATNPDVTSALAQMGNVWETLVLNGMNIADTTTLGIFNTVGEGRWGATVRKPFACFTGVTTASAGSAVTVSAARTTDRINGQLVAPGSPDLPSVVAARQLARIARVANNNPPVDYGGQVVDGITPGTDGQQWDYTARDAAVKAGSSTVEVRDGQIVIGDVVMFYAPSGDPTPAYRYLVDIVRLQNIIYNLGLIFEAQEWASAPLIPDAQPTTNRAARKPRQAVAAVRAMIDSLGLEAIISDPAAAKAATTASIDSGNPKRLNVNTVVALSGNTNVKDVELGFGFYYGTPAIVA